MIIIKIVSSFQLSFLIADETCLSLLRNELNEAAAFWPFGPVGPFQQQLRYKIQTGPKKQKYRVVLY